MGNNPYKDEKGHWTTKENDGGPCKHKNGNTPQERKGLVKETLVDKFNDAHLYNDGGKFQLALSNGKTEEFNTKNEAIDYLSKYSNRDYSWAKDEDDYENDLDEKEEKEANAAHFLDRLDKVESQKDLDSIIEDLHDAEANGDISSDDFEKLMNKARSLDGSDDNYENDLPDWYKRGESGYLNGKLVNEENTIWNNSIGRYRVVGDKKEYLPDEDEEVSNIDKKTFNFIRNLEKNKYTEDGTTYNGELTNSQIDKYKEALTKKLEKVFPGKEFEVTHKRRTTVGKDRLGNKTGKAYKEVEFDYRVLNKKDK